MTSRAAGVMAFCAGLLGFALAYFVIDPSDLLLRDAAVRVGRVESDSAATYQTMVELSDRIRHPQIVDLAPGVLNAPITDLRPAWMDVTIRSPQTRFLFDDGHYPMPQGTYGWKAIISNDGSKPLDACAYVRLIDRSGETVAIETPIHVVLDPFTARRYRGTIRYKGNNVSPTGQWQLRVYNVSIVFDPDEVRGIVVRDAERYKRGLIAEPISPYYDSDEQKRGVYQCTDQ